MRPRRFNDQRRGEMRALLQLKRVLRLKSLCDYFGVSESYLYAVESEVSRETREKPQLQQLIEFLQSLHAGQTGHLTAGPESGRGSAHSDQ